MNLWGPTFFFHHRDQQEPREAAMSTQRHSMQWTRGYNAGNVSEYHDLAPAVLRLTNPEISSQVAAGYRSTHCSNILGDASLKPHHGFRAI